MTPERLKQIRERCERATPGRWMVYDSCSWRRIGIDGEYKEILSPTVAVDGVPDLDGDNREVDLDFVVNARTDIPDLLAERDVLVKALKDIEQSDFEMREIASTRSWEAKRAKAALREVGEE